MTDALWRETPDGPILGTPDAPSRLEPLRYAPPFPGASVVPPAQVPPPPPLKPEASDDELALRALDAYRAVAENRTRRRCYVLRDGPGRYRALIAAGARVLVEAQIPPIAWCGWSFDQWHRRDSRGLPPIPYTFGHKRITLRRGWFWSESLAYLGGGAHYGPTHRDLLQRWNLMARHLSRAQTEQDARTVVERCFPGRSYDRLVQEARVEAEAEDARLRDAVRRGEWVW